MIATNSASSFEISVRREHWPLAQPFAISRDTKTAADVLVVLVAKDGAIGQGECVPYKRYGESLDSVTTQILNFAHSLPSQASWQDLHMACASMPRGAARNAIDCALLDWQCATGATIPQLTGLPPVTEILPRTTAFTISLASPSTMASEANAHRHLPLLKLKLGHTDPALDQSCLQAVRQSAPDTRLIVDANEAWRSECLTDLLQSALETGVELIEQPLPSGQDEPLAHIDRPVPICADESCHGANEIPQLRDRYDAINIKLDKAGGLTEAARMISEANRHGMRVMVGCMVCTSLAIAPALHLCAAADWIDLDGPLLLAGDHPDGIIYQDGQILGHPGSLWGTRASSS